MKSCGIHRRLTPFGGNSGGAMVRLRVQRLAVNRNGGDDR